MLDISKGIHDIGSIRWELAGCLLIAWLIVYCALWRGIKSIGKVGPELHNCAHHTTLHTTSPSSRCNSVNFPSCPPGLQLHNMTRPRLGSTAAVWYCSGVWCLAPARLPGNILHRSVLMSRHQLTIVYH